MDFPFNDDGCCPACGDAEEDSLLCDACRDMVRADPRTFRGQNDVDEFIDGEEQRHIELIWSSRTAFTVHDTEWLAELKVEYGDACGLESNAPLEMILAREKVRG